MFQSIDPKQLQENVFSLIGDQWTLITAGTPDHCNTMTASWGGLGVLWRKPVATIYVRPQRYTYTFLEENPYFTLSFFGPQWKKQLAYCGAVSGRVLVMAYYRTYGLPVTISRCSNNYGPYHFPEKLIPLMIINALHDRPLPIYGDGLNVRDWLYVEDHCRAIDLIIRKGKVGEVYNVGGHNEMRNIDIVKLICQELGKPESLITHVTDRKGHDRRYAIDPEKIHRELGWLPETKFADGIKKTIQWYLTHQKWWEDIISGEYQNYYQKMYENKSAI